jgi:DNA-directed RNA polymerase subunit K/omega
MSSKRGSRTSKKNKSTHTKNISSKSPPKKHYVSDDDIEEFIESEEISQSGGDTENESDTDNTTFDTDPDDEEHPGEEDKYDPINDIDEPEDPDEESDAGKETEEEEDEGEEIDKDVDEKEGDDGEFVGEEDGYTAPESKTCHMKNLNKDFIVLDEDDSNMYGKMEYKRIADVDRESDNIMTYYEMVRIIGTRAQQFNFGAEPLVRGLDGMHPAKMAYIELVAKMIPFIIRRHLPGKKYEEWRVDELEIVHQITDDFFVPEKFDWDALMTNAKKYSAQKEIITHSTNSTDSADSVDSSKSTKRTKPVKTRTGFK